MNHIADRSVLEPFYYISQLPGKDIRGTLIDCFSTWLQVPSDKLFIIKDIIRTLHNASLLIDDIEDSSKLRRNFPTAHTIYGIPLTINCGNYVTFLALEKCHQLNNQESLIIFTQELLNLHRGQGLEILWREQLVCPSDDEYKAMVLDKTGGLFRLAIGLMQSCSENKTDFRALLNLLGEFFQIRDDYINLKRPSFPTVPESTAASAPSSSPSTSTQILYDDITEGKFSYPIIKALKVYKINGDNRLLNILKLRTADTDLKDLAVTLIEQTGAMSATVNYLHTLLRDIRSCIATLNGHPGLESLLTKLAIPLLPSDDVLVTPPLGKSLEHH